MSQLEAARPLSPPPVEDATASTTESLKPVFPAAPPPPAPILSEHPLSTSTTSTSTATVNATDTTAAIATTSTKNTTTATPTTTAATNNAISSSQPPDLPPPPRFPSLNDVEQWPQKHTTDQSTSSPTPEISWKRVSSDALPTPTETPDDVVEPPKQSFLAKIMAMFKKKKPVVQPPVVQQQPPKTPPLVKLKTAICKLPDPTLLFVLEAAVILLVHTLKPAVLHTWPARIITPLVLVPTVLATALWRRTVVIPLAGRSVLSIVKPIPNASKVVSQGEALRAKEADVVNRERELKRQQMKLEVMRKQIEGRLPPQTSIGKLLQNEASN